MTLHRKFLKNILPPLILGIFITAAVSTIVLLKFTLNIVETEKEAYILAEYESLKNGADTIALATNELFSSKFNVIEELVNIAETLIYPAAKLNFSISEIFNSMEIAAGKINLKDYPNFDNDAGVSTNRSMWYLNPNITNANDLSEEEQNNLKLSFLLEPNLRSSYEGVMSLLTLHMIFMKTGLQYTFPSSKKQRYLNYTSGDYCRYTNKNDYFDFRCMQSINEILDFINLGFYNSTIFSANPTIIPGEKDVVTIVCGAHFINKTNKDYFYDPHNKIDFLICGEFIWKDFEITGKNDYSRRSYFIINYQNSVIYHHEFKNTSNFFEGKSITEYEFNKKDELKNEEALIFNKTIFKIIDSYYYGVANTEEYLPKILYNNNGEEMIGSAAPIYFPISNHNDKFLFCFLILVENSHDVLKVVILFGGLFNII